MINIKAKGNRASGSFFSSLKPITLKRKLPFDQMLDNKVRYRFVIDMQSLKDESIEEYI
ncbi:hypothetical protein [Mucilaginibacter aquaedulcis]|uniref:hypothetical protein n=1 Tax=Mucilaginibacter aquaedulcis TaxID=1187081 RepID=UPI0025B3B039|nr:hypothetical protein [Mucilaginibacter aquaedulcis]MDN3548184.1 hypothetical protein [Mucilaginibacter aquaedulcis]